MSTFQEKLLKAKHWQLFLIMIGVPIVGQVFFMATLFASAYSGQAPSPFLTGIYILGMILLMIICGGTVFGWSWSISTGLQSLVPTGVKMKVGKFKTLFYIPMVYLLLLIPIFGSSILLTGDSVSGSSGALMSGAIMLIIIPLHLLSIFGILYSIYFAAKTFKTVELQRSVQFSDFAGEFFLVWFYFIGVWIIQPKINQFLKAAESEEANL